MDIEQKFKQDIIKESSLNQGMIMINDEKKLGQAMMHLVPVTAASVTTLEEVYRKINRNRGGEQISLFRVPITDEQAPLATTIDQLIDIVNSNYKDNFVFNCQIGRGRTTTGMVICCMALAFKRGDWHSKNAFQEGDDSSIIQSMVRIPDDRKKKLLNGFYSAVSELVRMMKSGTKAKRKLDFIIDHNSDMQNIREVVYHYHVVVGNGNEM